MPEPGATFIPGGIDKYFMPEPLPAAGSPAPPSVGVASSPEDPGSSVTNINVVAQDWKTQTPFTDAEIEDVRNRLNYHTPQWSNIPRTYIVLRAIGQLDLLTSLVQDGFSDHWFPVKSSSLPGHVDPGIRANFVEAQRLVLTQSIDLEKGANGRHQHFESDELVVFESRGVLGSGGYGVVDQVLSRVSYREYARKRIPRKTVFNQMNQQQLRDFLRELEVMKKLRHQHIVDFIGSYTGPKYFGLLTSPIADMDLAVYLDDQTVPRSISKLSTIRSFFGCLATALAYLHDHRIRHKDVKSKNILVKGDRVLLTDFGLSRDSYDEAGSTTSGPTKLTRRYCAPEVAAYLDRNSSADVWSLGCVFLEMVAVLKSYAVTDIYNLYETLGTHERFPYANQTATIEVIALLRTKSPAHDHAPLTWIEQMLCPNRLERPTAMTMTMTIREESQDPRDDYGYCGICCLAADDASDSADDLADLLRESALAGSEIEHSQERSAVSVSEPKLDAHAASPQSTTIQNKISLLNDRFKSQRRPPKANPSPENPPSHTRVEPPQSGPPGAPLDVHQAATISSKSQDARGTPTRNAHDFMKKQMMSPVDQSWPQLSSNAPSPETSIDTVVPDQASNSVSQPTPTTNSEQSGELGPRPQDKDKETESVPFVNEISSTRSTEQIRTSPLRLKRSKSHEPRPVIVDGSSQDPSLHSDDTKAPQQTWSSMVLAAAEEHLQEPRRGYIIDERGLVEESSAIRRPSPTSPSPVSEKPRMRENGVAGGAVVDSRAIVAPTLPKRNQEYTQAQSSSDLEQLQKAPANRDPRIIMHGRNRSEVKAPSRAELGEEHSVPARAAEPETIIIQPLHWKKREPRMINDRNQSEREEGNRTVPTEHNTASSRATERAVRPPQRGRRAPQIPVDRNESEGEKRNVTVRSEEKTVLPHVTERDSDQLQRLPWVKKESRTPIDRSVLGLKDRPRNEPKESNAASAQVTEQESRQLRSVPPAKRQRHVPFDRYPGDLESLDYYSEAFTSSPSGEQEAGGPFHEDFPRQPLVEGLAIQCVLELAVIHKCVPLPGYNADSIKSALALAPFPNLVIGSKNVYGPGLDRFERWLYTHIFDSWKVTMPDLLGAAPPFRQPNSRPNSVWRLRKETASLFLLSGLQHHELKPIMELSQQIPSTVKDEKGGILGRLGMTETRFVTPREVFCVVMHLVLIKVNGVALPSELPRGLIPPFRTTNLKNSTGLFKENSAKYCDQRLGSERPPQVSRMVKD